MVLTHIAFAAAYVLMWTAADIAVSLAYRRPPETWARSWRGVVENLWWFGERAILASVLLATIVTVAMFGRPLVNLGCAILDGLFGYAVGNGIGAVTARAWRLPRPKRRVE